ncbi:ML domain-containing protein [Streptomyces sp. NBC_01077]|uniref:ML domain-containing protein n=1 Tax=Streptomyces sp. NBC_01077 TaxID=2903746 RepID=UPI00386BCFC4|nr:ML domain-containing protein [Streptomyces sp. NBC_01077]
MSTWDYEDAGLPTDALQIQSITITPDPPQPGSPAKMTIKATVQEAIEEGAFYNLTVKLGLIKLLQKQIDLFEELRSGTLTVTPDPAGGPIKPGEVELTYALNLPREVPKAKFNLDVAAFNANEEDLATLKFRFDFTR